uniref:Uncharacterized protein n=1 Tax=Aegilops tauschii TaxID=37682 RepID=M8BF67_AEGTA
MASMWFSYAQVHVKQERLRRRISEEASAATTMGKSMTGEDENESFTGEEKKAASNKWTAGAGRGNQVRLVKSKDPPSKKIHDMCNDSEIL